MEANSTRYVESPAEPWLTDSSIETREDDQETTVAIHGDLAREEMIYNVTDRPPWILTCFYACQIVITQVSMCSAMSLMVNDLVCGDSALKSQIMSTNLIMAGLCTFLQRSIGSRLPLFQGPTYFYILPMMLRANTDWACPAETINNFGNNSISLINMTMAGEEEWRSRILRISGSLMMISVFHMLFGMLGIIGFLTKYIGPLTVMPALMCAVLEFMKSLMRFAEIHWGITVVTVVVTFILSSYMGDMPIPFPFWTRQRGCHIVRKRFLRSSAIVLGVVIGWLFAYVLTIAGALTNDQNAIGYQARTDSQQNGLDLATWFYIPYPGQYGVPRFELGIFFSLIAAMLASVLDSVGDYLACAKVCKVPNPPAHATNRGLVVEGFCSLMAGAFGCCMATTTYSSLIGMITLSGVASRVVFVLAGVYLMVLGLIGKVAAFLVSIPKPVIAGNTFVCMGSLIGMCVAIVGEVDMSLPRNVITFGFAFIMGLNISPWVNAHRQTMKTGYDVADQLIMAVLGNPMFVGGLIGCFLDNTLPGKVTKDSAKTELIDDDEEDIQSRDQMIADIYDPPFIGHLLRRHRWTRFIPIFPGFKINTASCRCGCRRKRC